MMPNLPLTGKASRLYHSYLVRLWQDDSQLPWRALAQSIQTGETIHFADLPSLFAFLQAQTTNEQPAVAQDQSATGSETVRQ